MWIILVINYPSQTWKLWSFEGEQHIYIFLYASIRWNKIQRGRAELFNFFKENILTDSSRKTRSSRILNLGRFVLWQLYARKTKKETSFFFWKCLTILNSRSKVNNLLFILSLSLFLPRSTCRRRKKVTVIRPTLFQNAAEKMRLLVLVLAGILNVLVFVRCQELSVIRHSDGDIFTLEGKDQAEITSLSYGAHPRSSRNWRNRKLRTRDDFAQPCWGRGDRTGSDIKNNGKEERCLRKVSRGAVKHKGNREGREEGKKSS